MPESSASRRIVVRASRSPFSWEHGQSKGLSFYSQIRSDGSEPGAARRKNSYPMPAIPW